MSNRTAIEKCADLIYALDECRRTSNVFQKATGKCFELERLVRVCRHEARLEDRKAHVGAGLEKRRRYEKKWKEIEADEDV